MRGVVGGFGPMERRGWLVERVLLARREVCGLLAREEGRVFGVGVWVRRYR